MSAPDSAMPAAVPMTDPDRANPARIFICPECGSVATVMWANRPICVHSWEGNAGTPEIWDGDNADGYGRKIEESPNEDYRVPGPRTWAQMIPWHSVSMT